MAVEVRFSPEDAKLFQRFAQQEAKLKELQRGYRTVGQTARRAGKSAADAFDPKRALKGFITGLVGTVGVAAALRTVIRLYSDMKARAREAAAGTFTVQDSLKSLIQIAGGDPARFKALRGTAAGLVRDQGFTELAANQLVFKGISGGFNLEQVKRFGRIREIADPEALLESIGGLRGAFGEQVGGGRVDSVVNALLVAAKESNVNVERLAPELLTAAQLVKDQGGTFEELAAILGVISRGAGKSPEIAATQIRALAQQLEALPETRGLGVIGGVLKVIETFSEERKRKTIGANVRSKAGFGVIAQNLKQIERIQREIIEAEAATGTPQSLVEQSIAIARGDPTLRALTGAQRARGRRVLTEQERLGLPELRIQTIQDLLREVLTREGRGAVAQGLSLGFVSAAARFSSDPERIADIATDILRQNIAPQRGNPRLVRGIGGIASLETDPITPGQTAEFQRAVADFRESIDVLLNGMREVGGGATLAKPNEDR